MRQSTGSAKYSARCLETLSTLSQQEATLLERIATVTMVTEREGGASECFVVLSVTDYRSNSSNIPDLRNTNRQLVDHVGNIHSEIFGPIGIFVDDGWAHEVAGAVQNQTVHITIGQRRYQIGGYPSPLPQNPNLQIPNAVFVGSGTQLSAVGSEIISLIQAAPDDEYVRLLSQSFACIGLSLSPAD